MPHDEGDGDQGAGPLNAAGAALLRSFSETARDAVELVVGDDGTWMALEESASTVAFADASEHTLRITPFVGDDDLRERMYALAVGPSAWLDGAEEMVVDLRALILREHRDEVVGVLRSALEHWSATALAPRGGAPGEEHPQPTPPPPDALIPPVADVGAVGQLADAETVAAARHAQVRVAAAVNAEWSWASASARIPQIYDLVLDAAEPIDHARLSVRVHDADVEIGTVVVREGSVPAGTTHVSNVLVPLSPRVMSQVTERCGATCTILLEDVTAGTVVARRDEAIDLQPRDLWLWAGDPRRDAHLQVQRRLHEIRELVEQAGPEGVPAEVLAEAGRLTQALKDNEARTINGLAETLLASFVRPNHPEIAVIAREAAAWMGGAGHGESFQAFQLSAADAEAKVEASVDAIYAALRARGIAYSEPPPGWDYTNGGQRIRDHGDVARGGLGTCMDTTVLFAAVMEHVGLHPVLFPVQIPDEGGHIFIGYWRRDLAGSPEWYPDAPLVSDPRRIVELIEGGWLGVIETTTLAVESSVGSKDARLIGRSNVQKALSGRLDAIDVLAARKTGVSPLPAVNERADGVTEVIEYRSGGDDVQNVVAADDPVVEELRERQTDDHPPRYRTWKSSLFSLNATNDLLNLKSNAGVQSLVLPPEGLGALEDKLNQDASFSLKSGYDIPAVWQGRGVVNAVQLLGTGTDSDREDLLGQLKDRKIFVQRLGRLRGEIQALPPATFVKELRSMAHRAKTARDERGMNPLFLCLGLLRWPHKPGVFAEAPLILVPVKITTTRGRTSDLALSLDTTQQTTPNAALLEWLRREHDLTIPGLAEPITDRAGIDVDAVLTAVREAVQQRGLPFDIRGEARLAMLDLSSFRMWQDLNAHAERFLDRPLVKHLVHTPVEQFIDSAIDPVVELRESDELESLETPVPADSTQKRAVVWARQGRTFVLQGPPGTGKSQTITNMVGECLLQGLRVLFVAEKGTALAVVQRRLEEIGIGPFSLNLHHEGSNATVVRSQLRRALDATATPDQAAMENARRRLRNARFELTTYPEQLHAPNAAGFSAYSAHDELLVLGEGQVIAVSEEVVAHEPDLVSALKDVFEDLQPWTAAAGVRPDHPWRLAGAGAGDPFDTSRVTAALEVLLAQIEQAGMAPSARDLLDAATHPRELQTLRAAASEKLPGGSNLDLVLNPSWPAAASLTLRTAAARISDFTLRLRGFDPAVLKRDLPAIAAALDSATSSGMFGRGKRQTAAIEPLRSSAPAGFDLTPAAAASVLRDLVGIQAEVQTLTNELAGLSSTVGSAQPDLFAPDPLAFLQERVDQIVLAVEPLRARDDWTLRCVALAREGLTDADRRLLETAVDAWATLTSELRVDDSSLKLWRGDRSLAQTVRRHATTWRREITHERLLPLQQWCAMIRRLEPLEQAKLAARDEILDGSLPAYAAEDAFARGLAEASLKERLRAAGLDRFDAVAHDERVRTYSEAQAEVRRQWVTDGPHRLLRERGGEGRGVRSGGLARELDKTTRKLGTRAVLRKYGDVIQELTPLVLCSPASVVDLIEPGVMDFDVVIFDEASQITVPEAVGALGRARAAIIVGDSKQMPPTRKVGGPSSSDEEIDDPDAEELVEDAESILSECEVARVPTLRLSWHYRSQDEALIAFSNKTYYRGELSSFPTPSLLSSETGVEFIPAGGHYIRAGDKTRVDLGNGIVAGTNTNPVEAQLIVEKVCEMIDDSSPDQLPSIGIVTFNEQQRQLIADLLQASSHPRISEIMDENGMGLADVLFVKPLEQVQGDERDTIIFSVAFSRQANGIPTNFGPLSNSGGERRLNVAVTRARRKNVVFCSFDPAELNVKDAMHKGPVDLKEFLTFAKSATSVGAESSESAGAALRDRHRDEIAASLRAEGLEVMTDVGLSDFKLDLVLARSEDPRHPLLPVLLDGESWRRRKTVSDRDVLPVEVLRDLMGWPAVARVWWPMWQQNREQVMATLLEEVSRAEVRFSGESPLEVDDGAESSARLDSAPGVENPPSVPERLPMEHRHDEPEALRETTVSKVPPRRTPRSGSAPPMRLLPEISDEEFEKDLARIDEVASRAQDSPPTADLPSVQTYGRSLDDIEPDLARIEKYTYYDYRTDKKLPKSLVSVVEALVLDPMYDGEYDSDVTQHHTAHLAPEEAESVEQIASSAWDQAMGQLVERKAKKVVRELAADPDFDALPWGSDYTREFLSTHLAATRPAVVKLVEQLLERHAYESGMMERVERELQEAARAALAAMSPLERDVYGFSSRNAKRLVLAEPYLRDVVERRHRHVIYWMSRIESEETGPGREARYATAARLLVAAGTTRAATSRMLGISTSVMDRIQRENRRDVELSANDPIVIELAPVLAQQ